MISTHSRSSRQVSRQGFSLIEVAIALVIFVIGALAIIRIFPGALSVINNNGVQQLANNMNRDLSTKLKSQQTVAATATTARVDFNAVPDATFNNSRTTTNPATTNTLSFTTWDPLNVTFGPSVNHSADFIDVASSVIGAPRLNDTLPTTQEIELGNGNSSLSRYRAIVGERAQITNINEGGGDVPYALTKFPISVRPQTISVVPAPIQPIISQDITLKNVRIRPDGSLDFDKMTVDDLNNETSSLPVRKGSMLFVSYRYVGEAPYSGTWGVSSEGVPIDLDITDLRTENNVKVQPPVNSGRRDKAVASGMGLVPASVVPEIVSVRARRYIGLGELGPATATTDVERLEKVAEARRGLVRLPAGVLTTKPIVIDYVADWSFLMQDGIPLNASSTVTNGRQLALGAPFIEDQQPAGVYSLLLNGNTAFRSGYGTAAPEPDVANKLVLPTDPTDREDELRAGRATFLDARSDSRARVAYKTRDNWVQQLSVAASSYTPFARITTAGGAVVPVEPWRQYILGNDNYLYFHAGEAGKTINVSYQTTDSNGIIADRPFVISAILFNAAGLVPTEFSTGQVTRVKLTNSFGGEMPDNPTFPVVPTDPANLISIQSVRGVSITSRSAYINGDKYAQKLLTSNRGAK